jgi:hypothetical protein
LFGNEGKIRAIPEFAKVSQINSDPAQLSARRRRPKWGWIKKDYIRIESGQLSKG